MANKNTSKGNTKNKGINKGKWEQAPVGVAVNLKDVKLSKKNCVK